MVCSLRLQHHLRVDLDTVASLPCPLLMLQQYRGANRLVMHSIDRHGWIMKVKLGSFGTRS
jgi:hypothetical protein